MSKGLSWLQQALVGYASAGIGYLHSMSNVQLGEAHLLAGRVEEAWEFGTRAVRGRHARYRFHPGRNRTLSLRVRQITVAASDDSAVERQIVKLLAAG
jgi:hypothetical protein